MHNHPIKIDGQVVETPVQFQPLWRYKQFAEYLGISEDKARHDMCAGVIPKKLFIRIFGGRSIRFIPEEVVRFVREQSENIGEDQ